MSFSTAAAQARMMNERIVFKASLRGMLPLVFGVLFFGGAGIAMFLHPLQSRHLDDPHWFQTLTALFYRSVALLCIAMGVAAVAALIFFLARPLFILDQQGIRIPKLRRMEVFAPWSEITGVDCDASDQYILIYVAHPKRYAGIDKLSKEWGFQPKGTLALTVGLLSEANRKRACDLIRQRLRDA